MVQHRIGHGVVGLHKVFAPPCGEDVIAIAGQASPQGGELGIHVRGGDRALLDVDQFMPVVAVETNLRSLRVDADAVAVRVLQRGSNGRTHRHLGKMAHTPQGLLDLRRLHLKLTIIPDVLVGAPAALAKIGAARLDAIRRGLIDGNQLRLRKFSSSSSAAP